ncbi:carbohydrate porin [Vibrio cholerae]
MKKVSVIAAAVAATLAAGSAFASDLEFHGYMRAGLGFNADGGNAYAYGNGGSGHKVGRLGDEVDTYAEFSLAKGLYEKDGKKFSVHTLFTYQSPEGSVDFQGNSMQRVGSGGPFDSGDTSLREAYAKGDMGNYTIWAGKRYYARKDIHISDFYYLNNSGYGGGVENIDAGIGQFAFAVTKWSEDWQANDDNNNSGGYEDGVGGSNWRTAYKLDARLSGIEANENGSIDLAVIYGFASLSDGQKAHLNSVGDSFDYENDGVLLTFEHTQGNFFGGFNKFIVQYGTDGMAVGGYDNHAGEGLQAINGDGFRIIDWGVIEQDSWNLGYNFMYGSKSVDETGANAGYIQSKDFYNAVIRPGYKWNDVQATVLELGYYNERVKNGDWEDLSKITIAQEWNAGSNFWARPSIRLYATQYFGDMVNPDANGNKAETMFGIQAEAWW